MAREQRKLAAILAADVVGYFRLMERDESWNWRANESIVVKLIGDGAFVEFASAVDALSAAIEFQQPCRCRHTCHGPRPPLSGV